MAESKKIVDSFNIDEKFNALSVALASNIGRRSFLGKLGKALFAFGTLNALPLLPVDRIVPGVSTDSSAQAAENACENCDCPNGPTDKNNDPSSCKYWKYARLNGFPCNRCGGSISTCPAGTIAAGCWKETVRDCDGNMVDVLYQDCCVDKRTEESSPAKPPGCTRCGLPGIQWCWLDRSGTGSCQPTIPFLDSIVFCTLAK